MEPVKQTTNAASGGRAETVVQSSASSCVADAIAKDQPLKRNNSGGLTRHAGSRREDSGHEIFRRRSSRALLADGSCIPSIAEDIKPTPSIGVSTSNEQVDGLMRTASISVRGSNERTDHRPTHHLARQLSRRSSASSLSLDQAEERKDKKHSALVERFQIRQLHRSSSDMKPAGSPIRNSSGDRKPRPPRAMSLASAKPLDITSNLNEESLRALGQSVRPNLEVVSSNGRDRREVLHSLSNRSHKRDNSTASARRHEPEPATALMCRLEHQLLRLLQPMSPLSDTFRARQVVTVVALAVHVVYFPLEAAFNYSPGSSSIEMVVEMVFFLDFLLNLNTAYVNRRGQLVSDRRQIALQYLGGWFLVDMVSSLPVEWMRVRHDFVYDLIGRTPRILHTIRLVRFVWFLRLDQSGRNVLSWLFYSRYSHLLRIAWVILALIVVAHYMACCWRLLVTSKAPTSILEDDVSCYYDVLQLLQGQGVPTTSLPQNVFAAVATLAGSLVLAIVFVNVGILVSNFNANATSYQYKMESVFAIMTKLQLPTPLRERIHQYYEHLWREYESLDGEIVAFSKGLSHTLQLEVVLFKYMDLITNVPFWRDTSPDFQKQLMLSLHVRVFLPDDFIIRRGEVGNEFFMINRGICELVLGPDSLETTTFEALVDEDCGSDKASSRLRSGRVSEGNSTSHKLCFDKVQAAPASGRSGGNVAQDQFPHSRRLRRGQTFGELALLMNYERTSNVRALTCVEMCVLRREDVQRIFVKHLKARRSVITDLLVRAMESNEMHNVPCPLKAMIQNALPVEDHTRLSPMHAALMIADAIDEQRDDYSIKFGVGPSLQQRLYEMVRGQREQNKRQNSLNAPKAAPHSVHHAPDSSGENQNHESRLREAMNRIESLEATQVQVLQLVRDMHAEVHKLRRAHATAMHACVHNCVGHRAPILEPIGARVSVGLENPEFLTM